jgi:hypothetical protein
MDSKGQALLDARSFEGVMVLCLAIKTGMFGIKWFGTKWLGWVLKGLLALLVVLVMSADGSRGYVGMGVAGWIGDPSGVEWDFSMLS